MRRIFTLMYEASFIPIVLSLFNNEAHDIISDKGYKALRHESRTDEPG